MKKEVCCCVKSPALVPSSVWRSVSAFSCRDQEEIDLVWINALLTQDIIVYGI